MARSNANWWMIRRGDGEGKLMNLIKRCDDNWLGLRKEPKRAKSISETAIFWLAMIIVMFVNWNLSLIVLLTTSCLMSLLFNDWALMVHLSSLHCSRTMKSWITNKQCFQNARLTDSGFNKFFAFVKLNKQLIEAENLMCTLVTKERKIEEEWAVCIITCFLA